MPIKKPKSERWFVCELVHECVVKGSKSRRCYVWVNIHLISAADPEAAYRKAMALGRSHNNTYPSGENWTPTKWIFRGIRDVIGTVDDIIEDGAEIMFEKYPLKTKAGVKRMIQNKADLSIFKK